MHMGLTRCASELMPVGLSWGPVAGLVPGGQPIVPAAGHVRLGHQSNAEAS